MKQAAPAVAAEQRMVVAERGLRRLQLSPGEARVRYYHLLPAEPVLGTRGDKRPMLRTLQSWNRKIEGIEN